MLPSGRINCDMARSSMNESGYVWRDKLTHNVPPICLWFDTFPGLWGQRTTPCAGKRKMKQNLLDEWMTLVFSRFKELCGAWINTRQIYSSKPTFPEKINNDEVICSIGRKWSASPKRATLQWMGVWMGDDHQRPVQRLISLAFQFECMKPSASLWGWPKLAQVSIYCLTPETNSVMICSMP